MQTDEEPETTITDDLEWWRERIESRGNRRRSAAEDFILDLGDAYDELTEDYVELGLMAEELRLERDVQQQRAERALAELQSLRERLRGLGGAA